MSDRPSLTLRRRIRTSPARVFAAWTDPRQIPLWWGPAGSVTLSAEADPRPGGRYHVVFITPDGEQHDVSGTYEQVVPDAKLVFTWMWRTLPDRVSLVTIDIVPDGDHTLLTLTHERFFDEAARDGHREGWSSCLDRLVALFAPHEETTHAAS